MENLKAILLVLEEQNKKLTELSKTLEECTLKVVFVRMRCI
jgi:hypothetical protein